MEVINNNNIVVEPITSPKRKSRNGAKDKKPRKSHRSNMPKIHIYFCNGSPYLSAFRRVDDGKVIIKEYFNYSNHMEKLRIFLDKYSEAFGVDYADYIRLPKNFRSVKEQNHIINCRFPQPQQNI